MVSFVWENTNHILLRWWIFFIENLFKNSSLLSIAFHNMNLVEQSVHFVLLRNVVQYTNMGDEKKKETKIEKKDEFGNTVEETEIEEKEED